MINPYSFGDRARRRQVRESGLNGLDTVEVRADGRSLDVTFLGKLTTELTRADVLIVGEPGDPVLTVERVAIHHAEDPDADDRMVVILDRHGGLSPYTMTLIDGDESDDPTQPAPPGFDQLFCRASFSFAADCAGDADCLPADGCVPEVFDEPDLSYLAKDYESFRRLLLDRLALLLPGWTERHIPDIGITLVELLAYVGDHLSYYQDAVAAEAYLGTARRRISVRRHVRLVDYLMHDGCNARAFVCLDVPGRLSVKAGQMSFHSRDGQAFEPLADRERTFTFIPEHSTIDLWTWGDSGCHLPAGATSATLKDAWTGPPDMYGRRPRALRLAAGDLLLLEEIAGAVSGKRADANPGHRQVVRLTRVESAVDDLFDQPVLNVFWAQADALGFTLPVSVVVGNDCELLVKAAVARGNLLLADHGLTRPGAAEPVELPAAVLVDCGCAGPGEKHDPAVKVPRSDPRLSAGPVTQSTGYPADETVAAQQARLLQPIPAAARRRMRQLLARARGGQELEDRHLAEIVRLFGSTAVAAARLAMPPARGRPPQSAEEQARALHRLVSRINALLAKKVRWLRTLARRCPAGLRLHEEEIAAIEAAWGERYVGALTALDAMSGPAGDALRQDPRAAMPAVTLHEPVAGGEIWSMRRDLLSSGPDEPHVVGETDDDGVLHLRFGDGRHGRTPQPGAVFEAHYRVGNGTAGNVGADTITEIRFRGIDPGMTVRVRNPLPARGGTDPEPVSEVRTMAPGAFRRDLVRAITAEDYGTLAARLPDMQGAAGRLRWNGSWYEAQVALDPLGATTVHAGVLTATTRALHPYRRIGHDLTVRIADYVPIDLALTACLLPRAVRGQVRTGLRAAIGALFAPDRLTFGTDVTLSGIVAAAAAVPGVDSVEVTVLQRLHEGDAGQRLAGVLPIGPLEIARLDDDPARPGNGRLALDLRGGR
ncbi:putative baseplate assembly protein [Jidongwangia harbinensis]|uniref:putative baseplate assembly protein n=1 Tax=Jidongwangia harbinensis TaxID=2878561 RepID=UPI001CDA27A4|nr:putative baseplate assembly protein [Jidongwangia harbinensis]MCA2218022.1 putative baseplate assembly protein [Jidongwangia harbinensis]